MKSAHLTISDMKGSLPSSYLQPLLQDLAARSNNNLTQLEQEFPHCRLSDILAGSNFPLDRSDFARLYGRTSVLLAAAISGEEQGAAEEYASRIEFMVTVLLSSKTLGDAVRNMSRFNAMMADHGIAIKAVPDFDYDRIEIDIHRSLPGAPMSLLTVCIIFIINTLSWLCGARIVLKEVGLTCPKAEPVDSCLAQLGVPILAGQASAYIRLAPGTLDQQVSNAAPRAHETLDLICHDPAYWHDFDKSIAARLHQAMSEMAASIGHCPDRLAICNHMKLSPSTLHRRLNAEGTSFQHEKIEWQRKVAIEMIGQGSTMKTIAKLLGFQDARSFRRAFLAWTGKVPSSMRDSRRG